MNFRANRKKWLIAGGIAVAAGVIAVLVTSSIVSRRFTPFIREQAVLYLQERFDSEVELGALQVHMPNVSALRLWWTHGRGAISHVEGSSLSLRHKGRRDVPPMFVLGHFSFDVDLGTIFDPPRVIALVTLDGMQIHIPPKGDRPHISPGHSQGGKSGVVIEQVRIANATLVILPKDKKKIPLQFDLQRVVLESAGKDVAMKYDADLTNPKPPGQIHSTGTFGPWAAGEPGDTPLTGEYTFEHADLGVFTGIVGMLQSSGKFEGMLSEIHAQGQASVPDFRLKMSGNRVPLYTKFDALVNGTNGNTVLKPVVARLGSTAFTTSGGIIKHEGDQRKTITLDVSMPNGNLPDLLPLAMKGEPFMEGKIFLKTKIDIPPLTQKVKEKLLLDGNFVVSEGKFLRSTIQDQIDGLSRRGQGQPKNAEIDEVVSRMTGTFHLRDEVVTFSPLSFSIPGAAVELSGDFDMDKNILDFHGALKLEAKVSQTMTGWKRWALRPADPFFAKNGAGTFLRIKVTGTAKEPKFGLDRGSKP